MKKAKSRPDDLEPEYDFATLKDGVRGKYAKRARGDVAGAMPTPQAPPKTTVRRSGR